MLAPHAPRSTQLAITLRAAIDFARFLGTYGTHVAIALPIAGGHIVAVCRQVSGSFCERGGHAPFLENPERFNRELALARAEGPMPGPGRDR
jgi:hypothetical protein